MHLTEYTVFLWKSLELKHIHRYKVFKFNHNEPTTNIRSREDQNNAHAQTIQAGDIIPCPTYWSHLDHMYRAVYCVHPQPVLVRPMWSSKLRISLPAPVHPDTEDNCCSLCQSHGMNQTHWQIWFKHCNKIAQTDIDTWNIFWLNIVPGWWICYGVALTSALCNLQKNKMRTWKLKICLNSLPLLTIYSCVHFENFLSVFWQFVLLIHLLSSLQPKNQIISCSNHVLSI